MLKEAIAGDKFYSLKYRKWFVIKAVDEAGITAMVPAPSGDLIRLHETRDNAERDLEPDGRTYPAKFTISYEVET